MGKGEDFERQTCKDLSMWWTHNSDNSVFWRTSQSGGRRTQRQKKGRLTPYSAGDVGLLDPIGVPFLDFFIVELKRGYTKTIDTLSFIDWKFKTNAPVLQQWFEKGEKERQEDGRHGVLLVFKRDRHRRCVMINEKIFLQIKNIRGCFPSPPYTCIIVGNGGNRKCFYIIKYTSFFNWMTPETVKEMLSKVKGTKNKRKRRKI